MEGREAQISESHPAQISRCPWISRRDNFLRPDMTILFLSSNIQRIHPEVLILVVINPKLSHFLNLVLLFIFFCFNSSNINK